MTPDLVWLAALAAEVLERPTDDALGAIDLEALDAVRESVAEAGADVVGQAAALLVSVVRERPLPRGNRRLAALGVTWLLGDAGLDLSFTDGEVLGKLCAAAERYDAGVDDVRAVLFDEVVHQGQEVMTMFERFTERSKKVLELAQAEGPPLGHDFVGTEHLVLAMLREGEGVAAHVLTNLGVSYDDLLAAVRTRIGGAPTAGERRSPFTPRAKKVLELALREALQLGHNYIGTEHMLLGVVREAEGLAMHVLEEDFDVTGPQLRNEVIRVLSGGSSVADEALKRYEELTAAHPELTEDAERELGEAIAAGITERLDDDRRLAAEKAVDRLVNAHLRDVVRIVLTTATGGDVLARIQEGNLALIASAREWRPEHGDFASFAETRIRAELAPSLVDRPPRRRRFVKGEPTARCSFCGKAQQAVQKLVAGPGVYICGECVQLCSDIVGEDVGGARGDEGDEDDEGGMIRCAGCGADPLADHQIVPATVEGKDVQLLACACGRVFGSV